MKLNHDCIRDLMLYLEENLSFNGKIYLNSITDLNYSKEDILYTAEKLCEADYINIVETDYGEDDLPLIVVTELTYSGHCFLDTIRDNGVWTKTKGIVSKFTSVSIQLISSIASQVITQLISASLNSASLNP